MDYLLVFIAGFFAAVGFLSSFIRALKRLPPRCLYNPTESIDQLTIGELVMISRQAGEKQVGHFVYPDQKRPRVDVIL